MEEEVLKPDELRLTSSMKVDVDLRSLIGLLRDVTRMDVSI